MSNRNKKKPISNLKKSKKSLYYNLVRDDATLINKAMKWLILIHLPLYYIALMIELFNLNYPKNGYVGPASMIFPMSLTGAIIIEIVYFSVITSISVSLLIAMQSFRKNNPKLRINKPNN